jgi:hypothetical protein
MPCSSLSANNATTGVGLMVHSWSGKKPPWSKIALISPGNFAFLAQIALGLVDLETDKPMME